MTMLSKFEQIQNAPGIGPALSIINKQGEARSKKAKETTKQSYGIDPNRLVGPRDPKPLGDTIQPNRIRICDLLIDDVLAFPQTRKHPITGRIIPNGHGTWNRIRALPVDGALTVDQALQRPEIQSSVMALEKVIDLLLRAREQRRELEENLRQLDAIAAAFASSEMEPAVQ